MPTNPEVVAALPSAGGANHAALRNAIMGRTPYTLADDEDSSDLVCTDPVSGRKVLALIYKGIIFSFDPLDSSTEHDGLTCLVSYDELRYLAVGLNYPDSVLDKDLTEPPEDPAFGDAYLVYGTGEGDWATFNKKIAIFTARGWEAITLPIGRKVYVEDEDSYYYLDSNGDLQSGVGVTALQDASVAISKLIGGGDVVSVVVINMTTQIPPSSPTKSDAYIIAGPSPTGAWAGNVGKLTVWEGLSWEIYSPQEGWRIYDQDTSANYQWDGSAWVSQAGALLFFTSQPTQGTSNTTDTSSTNYTYSTSTAPTTSNRRKTDDVTISRAARNGAKLRLRYSCTLNENGGGAYATAVALFRDGESNAIAWQKVPAHAAGDILELRNEFVVTAPDASSHTYKMAIMCTVGYSTSVEHRLFTLEEFS